MLMAISLRCPSLRGVGVPRAVTVVIGAGGRMRGTRGADDHFAADRNGASRLLQSCPQLRDAVRENRAFVAHAVTWATRQRIRQFADFGTGMPARPVSATRPGGRFRRPGTEY